MVMKIEIAESWTDYSSTGSAPCPLSVQWLMSSTSNFALAASVIDPSQRALHVQDSGTFGQNMLHMFAAAVTKITVAFNFNWYEWGSDGLIDMFRVLSLTGAQQLAWTVNNVGKLIVKGEGGATLATSHTNIQNDLIHRCCFQIEYVSNNNCNISVSINGFPDPGLTLTGIDLQDDSATTMGGVRIYTGHNSVNNDSGTWELLELMVGTGECVDWGPIELVDFYANVDIVSDWTPLSGTDNFAMIDDVQADGDTTYNSTETINAKDIFGFADGEVPESVIAVGFCSWHKKEDSATRRWRHVVRVDGTDYPNVDVFSSDSWGRRIDFWTQNPDTAADWDPADLAGVQGGYEYLGA